jgi:N-methylhydantoinase A
VNQPLPELDEAAARAILAEQVAEGRALLEREAVPIEGVRVLHRADMQFQGQSHILSVDLPDAAITRAGLAEAFAQAYWRRFEVELAELRPVLVNLHTAVIGLRPTVDLERLIEAGDSLEGAKVGQRPVWFDGEAVLTPIYRREKLPRGARFAGPAIVEQLDATTVVEPGCEVEVDRLGNLLITV